MSNEPRAYTKDETRDIFLREVWNLVKYWNGVDRTTEGKLSGLAFSIMSLIDGEDALPGFELVVDPHPDDASFHRKRGENWFKRNDIAGDLHCKFHDAENNGLGVRPIDALQRGVMMASQAMNTLPPLALGFARHLSRQIGMCSEVMITAFAVYAQCVEGLNCGDDLYRAIPEHIKWFAENKDKPWRISDGVLVCHDVEKVEA